MAQTEVSPGRRAVIEARARAAAAKQADQTPIREDVPLPARYQPGNYPNSTDVVPQSVPVSSVNGLGTISKDIADFIGPNDVLSSFLGVGAPTPEKVSDAITMVPREVYSAAASLMGAPEALLRGTVPGLADKQPMFSPQATQAALTEGGIQRRSPEDPGVGEKTISATMQALPYLVGGWAAGSAKVAAITQSTIAGAQGYQASYYDHLVKNPGDEVGAQMAGIAGGGVGATVGALTGKVPTQIGQTLAEINTETGGAFTRATLKDVLGNAAVAGGATKVQGAASAVVEHWLSKAPEEKKRSFMEALDEGLKTDALPMFLSVALLGGVHAYTRSLEAGQTKKPVDGETPEAKAPTEPVRAAEGELATVPAQEPAGSTPAAEAPPPTPPENVQPSAPQEGVALTAQRIRPETAPERADRALGDTFSALERVVRDEFQGGTAARKEPTYTGTEGELGRDPIAAELKRRQREDVNHQRRNERFYKPIMEGTRAAGITIDDLGEIYYARHAPERNALLAQRNPTADPAIRNQLSGMTNAEASQTMAKWKADPRWEKIQPILNRLDAMTRSDMDRQMRAGRLSIAQRQSMPFTEYAPLMSKPEEGGGTMGGRSGAGQVYKHTLGRTSRAENPAVMAIVQDMANTAKLEGNRGRQALARLVQRMGNNDFAELVPESDFSRRGLVQKGGEQVVGDLYDFSFPDQPNAVPVRLEGQKYAIVFGKDYQDFAEAWNGQSWTSQLNRTAGAGMRASIGPTIAGHKVELNVLRLMPWFSRFMKSISTKDNPLWLPINVVKDTPATITRQWSERGPVFAAKVAANVPKMARELVNDGPVAKRYRDAGGMMPTMGVEGFDTVKARIDNFVANGDHVGAIRQALSKIETTNMVAENMYRLSVFDQLTKSGMDDRRAAIASDEANVNFSRRGEIGPAIEAAQPFYQAGVNGLRALTKVARGKRFYQVALTMAAGAIAQDQLNRTVAGDDANGENNYDKLPQWEKDDNFIFMWPDGSGRYNKIPKPPGLAWFFNAPMYLSAAAAKAITPEKAAALTGTNLLESLNPVGNLSPTEMSVTSGYPAVARPIAESLNNKDYAGNVIVPENQRGQAQLPDYQRARRGVNPILREATQWAAESTGEAVDVSPSTIEHLLRGYFPGIIQELARSASVTAKAAAGEKVEARDIPVVRRFYGEPSPYFTDALYLKNSEAIATDTAKFKSLLGPDGSETEASKAWLKENPDRGRKVMLHRVYEGLLGKIPNEPQYEDRRRQIKARFNRAMKGQN